MATIDADRAAKALAGPTVRGRSRLDRDKMPKPGQQASQPSEKPSADPGVTEAQSSQATRQTGPQETPAASAPEVTLAMVDPQTESTSSAAEESGNSAGAKVEDPSRQKAPKPPAAKQSPRKAWGPVDAARTRLAARTAEQTFLPLVSRIAKLREWVEQAVMAVADAKSAGVTTDHLEDMLRGIARKNGTTYTDIPESVRAAIDAEDSASALSDAARARLAARTAEQTFLPLVSRIAKLREWVEQSVLAIQDAKQAGVESEHLEDMLRGIARKTSVGYTDVPETVRSAITAD